MGSSSTRFSKLLHGNYINPFSLIFFVRYSGVYLLRSIIVLFLVGVIHDYSLFIKLFSFTYPGIAVILFLYLILTKKIHFTFQLSKVSKRFSKSILRLCSFVYVGSLIFTITLVFDSLVITAVLKNALAKLAVYSLAQNIANIIQSFTCSVRIISASLLIYPERWKDKRTRNHPIEFINDHLSTSWFFHAGYTLSLPSILLMLSMLSI